MLEPPTRASPRKTRRLTNFPCKFQVWNLSNTQSATRKAQNTKWQATKFICELCFGCELWALTARSQRTCFVVEVERRLPWCGLFVENSFTVLLVSIKLQGITLFSFLVFSYWNHYLSINHFWRCCSTYITLSTNDPFSFELTGY